MCFPQDEREGVLYLGIAEMRDSCGAFENDAVDLELGGRQRPRGCVPLCDGCLW